MNAFCQKLREFVRSEDGPTTTEYAVLLALICVAVMGALSSFGVHVFNIYTSIAAAVAA